MTEEKRDQGKPQSKKRGLHRSRRVLIPLFLTVVVGVIVFFYWYEYIRGYVTTDDAVIDSDAVTISSKVLGRVVSLSAGEGDTIKVGQLLVQIDDSDLKSQEAQARASLEYIRQTVSVARIAVDRAKEDYDRAAIQFNDRVITREQYDHARKALDMAQAQLNVALSQVKASEAQLAVVETQLGNTRIAASASGVVARKWVVPGDIVQPGQPIFTMFDLNNVWVTAYFEETKLASIHEGDNVEISVDAFPDRILNGKVEMIGAAAASQFSLIPPNNASGNFTKVTQRVPVKIVIAGYDTPGAGEPLTLLPGMSVEVRIRVKGK